MTMIRQPALAGAFYPADRALLDAEVRKLLRLSHPVLMPDSPKALVVPHAGYMYSGLTAAAAYTSLANIADRITRVILLGPAHTLALKGLALPGVEVFASPLGHVELDQAAIAAISHLKQVGICPAAHASEHCLEVQLPFLQTVLRDFKLVPLVVGHASARDVADVLDILWGGPETLLVISSDLSHYLAYGAAFARDADTIGQILALSPLHSHQQACGATPINGLLLAARRHHLHAALIHACNSGDTAGNKTRVVGYASFGFSQDEPSPQDAEVGCKIMTPG